MGITLLSDSQVVQRRSVCRASKRLFVFISLRMINSAQIILLLTLAAKYSCTSLSWHRQDTHGVAKGRWFSGFVHYQGELFLFGGEGSKNNSLSKGVLCKRLSTM